MNLFCSRDTAGRRLPIFIWLVFVNVVAMFYLWGIYIQSIGMRNGDAEWIYLPAGRKLIENPLNFITTDILSYSVAPLGYIWSAIWGVNESAIKLANCALFLICIYLIWRIALRLGGTLAAVAATMMWATTHTLLHAIPQVLTEAMYMFGFLLFVFGLVEAIVLGIPRIRWFAAASFGLTITLLSRPVLQYITCGTIFILVMIYVALRRGVFLDVSSNSKVFIRRAIFAFLLALVLPVLVIIKNGVYFNSWSIGTGAGAGLYYGLHPLHMGEEPFYTNFQYDVGHTASTIDPDTRGNLEVQADRWQKQIAFHLILQTSFADNMSFFASKARSWLLYSPIERHFDSEWREKRLAMVILIIAAIFTLGLSALVRGRGAIAVIFAQVTPIQEGNGGEKFNSSLKSNSEANRMFFCYTALLMLLLSMVVQFLPILYNARYNGAFLEPIFVILGSVSLALLARKIRASNFYRKIGCRRNFDFKDALGQVIFLLFLVYIFKVVTDWTQRNERLFLDPHRLGPTAVVLNGTAFGRPEAVGMEYAGNNEWVIVDSPSELAVPVNIPENVILSKDKIYEAIWRVNFEVQKNIPGSCRDVGVRYSQPESASSPLPPRIFLSRDGGMHAYAFSGGMSLRPQASGKLIFKFTCPVGVNVKWGSVEFLRSTMAEASRDLIRNGMPFSPYLSNQIQVLEK